MSHALHLAGGRTVPLDRPLVMGILNATPDSFSDGGALDTAEGLHGRIAALASADILDIGGESTRPGHAAIAPEEEIARIVPVIQAVREALPEMPISVDTSKAAVADAALRAGAHFINDVSALGDAAMADVALEHGCSVVVMRNEPLVGDAVESAVGQLEALAARAIEAGIQSSHLVLDAGLGFAARPGPHVDDNLALLDHVAARVSFPTLVGHSRKRFMATLAQDAGMELDAMTAQLARRAVDAGAAIVRVHDVASTQEALA